MLPYVQAFAEGKEIEVSANNASHGWITVENAMFNYRPEAYRIKPEKRVIKRWVALWGVGYAGHLFFSEEGAKNFCPTAEVYKEIEIEIEFMPGENK